MRLDRLHVLVGALAIGSGLALETPSASAQGYGSLGGYGAGSRYATPGMGQGSPMIIPYGGTFEGFMPSRMGGGSSLSFRSRPSTPMGSARSGFRLSPLLGGMSSMSGRAVGSRAGGREISPLGSPGVTRPGGMRRMPGAGGMGVMPPSIGYPFRQPPSPVGPPASGMGMSM